jgi:DNA helicase II / ATP-dependent DNA helicase PcrA
MSDSRAGNQFAAHSVKLITDQLAGLNAKQREAVEYGIKPGKTKDIGPLLVIAGADSGKTQTLAHRAANLLINGADPQRMVLLTFTRRAAREMTQRAGRIASSALKTDKVRLPWAGTFDAFGCCGNTPTSSA